jgi:hypothetical protein
MIDQTNIPRKQGEMLDELQHREQRLRQRKMVSDLLIILSVLLCILVVGGGIGWHYFYGPCGLSRVKQGGLALADQFDAYHDAYNIAESTARIALAGPVLQLQQVERSTALVAVPPCMERAKEELVQANDATVQAFLAFMSQNDFEVDAYLSQSDSHLAEFQTQLEAIEKCKPFCQTK